MFDNTIVGHLEHHRHQIEQTRENAGRFATQFITCETKGTGQYLLPNAVPFDSPIINEPAVTSGFALRQLPDRRWWQLPRVSAGPRSWVRNERGFYVGVFLYFNVDVEPRIGAPTGTPPVPRAVVIHHFSLSGLSYKLLGNDVGNELNRRSDLPTLTPSSV